VDPVDPRGPAQSAAYTPEQVFHMLTGETLLSPGHLTKVRVTSARPMGASVLCVLEASGCPGRCMIDDPRRTPPPPMNKVVEAVVLAVHPDDLVVRVSIHPDDLREPKQPRNADQYYRKRADPSVDREAGGGEESRKSALDPSVVHHPLFKDITTRPSRRPPQVCQVPGTPSSGARPVARPP